MTTVLAIDAGTTGVPAMLVARDGTVTAKGYREFPQHFPRPGWVEHDPEDIWQAVLGACGDVLADREPPVAIGLTNQRETAVVWDRETLAAPRRAIVWQDRRTTDICDELRPYEDRVHALTGLRLDPYFTGTKLTWLARNEPKALRGNAIGTVDSYVLARLTGLHATDPSNASRTLLYDIEKGAWSPELCDLLGVDMTALPEVRPSSGDFGVARLFGFEIPVRGIAGDQQAALFGQACYSPGESKCTYGTGSFVLVNTGREPVRSPGMLTTVAWDIGEGLVYALEGAIFVTGAAVQWLRDGLGLIATAAEVEELARRVPDSGGVVFVPALTGLGAPDWDPTARGLIAGVTRGTTAAHLARATLEAIAYEVRDVVDAMDVPLAELTVDGGASADDLLCEIQAAQLGVPVRRPATVETTALGAAFLAGLGAGVWSSTDELRETWRLDRRFEPEPGVRDGTGYRNWRKAVEKAKGWA